MRKPLTPSQTWRRQAWATGLALAGLVFFAFGVHGFVYLLNAVKVAGFPLGFYMAAQGSLVALAMALFLFARRRDRLDPGEGRAPDQ